MKTTQGSTWPLALVRIFLFMASFAMLTTNDARAEKSAREQLKEKYFLLGLVGYNYTDRNI